MISFPTSQVKSGNIDATVLGAIRQGSSRWWWVPRVPSAGILFVNMNHTHSSGSDPVISCPRMYLYL